MSQDWGKELIRNPRFMFGHSQVIHKDAALAVGGYDVTLRTNGEDADMSNKLRALGFECIYDLAATVRHYRTDSIATVLRHLVRLVPEPRHAVV